MKFPPKELIKWLIYYYPSSTSCLVDFNKAFCRFNGFV